MRLFAPLLALLLVSVAGRAAAASDAGAVEADATAEERAVEERLLRAYSLVAGLEQVRVRARAGVVALTGTAASTRASTVAERIAEKQPSVAYVTNRIEVLEQPAAGTDAAAGSQRDQELEEQLRAVFSRVDDLEDVSVTVSAGVVHLTGTTPSSDGAEKAEKLAAKLADVLYIDNDIEETREVGERVEPALDRMRDFARRVLARLPLFGVGLAAVIVFALLARAVTASERLFSHLVRNRMLRGIVRQLVATVLVIVGILLALDLAEATSLVGAVLGAAGLAGIAAGLAFRDIGENYLASILLGLRRPFEAGDHVVIGEHEGKVARLTTRETILMSLDGNHVRLPNAQVFKSAIVNYSRNPLRRLSFQVGVGATEDLVQAQRVGSEALRGTAGVVQQPAPFALVEELGDSNVVVRFFAWIDQRQADWFKVRSESVRRVKAALDQAGVALPVPIYRIQTDGAARSREAAARELEQSGCEVSVDETVERQVREDAARAPEENLLDPEAPPARKA